MPFRTAKTKIWQYDFQIRGRRFRGSCGTDDFEKAKAVEAAERVKAARLPELHGDFTLSEAIGTYISDISQHQSSGRTTISQGRAILDFIPGSTLLSSLSNAEISRFVARRRQEVAAGTINRQLQMLGRALRHMQRVHRAKVADLDLRSAQVKEPKERIRELSKEEQKLLFKHLRHDLHPWVQFALMTGARLATICELRWSDISLDTARMRFRIKGDDIQFFPINRELRAFLSALPRADEKPHSDYVITYIDQSSRAKKRRKITASGGISEEFRQALERAGIEDFRFHDLRHTFATRMLRQTGNLKLVSRLLGHKSIETTMRYAHVLDEDLADAMEEFSTLDLGKSRRKSQSAKKR